MKKMLFLLFLLSFTCISMYGQDAPMRRQYSTILQIDSLYKYYGVVFDSAYSTSLLINNLKDRFTPAIGDIVQAEEIFQQQYSQLSEAKLKAVQVSDRAGAKKKFSHYNRQYIGYIDTGNEKNIIIHLFDYSKKKAIRKSIGDSWKDHFVILFAEDPTFMIKTFRVNLKTGTLYSF